MSKPVTNTQQRLESRLESSLAFADHLKEIVVRFDRQFRHTFVNKAVESATGLQVGSFLGKTNREMGMPQELVATWELSIEDVFRTGLGAEISFSFEGPAGLRHFTSFLAPEKDGNDHVYSVISIARDLTETIDLRKRVFDHALAAHFKAIVDSSDDAIISKSLDGIVASWNRGAQTIFGYSEAEMLGQSLLILIPADRRDEERFILEKLIEGESVDHFETVRLHKDGRQVLVSVTISPVRDDTGRIVGVSKVARDITVRKQSETAQREHALRLQRVIEGANEAFWDLDLLTQEVQISDKWAAMLDYEPGEMELNGSNWDRFVHADDVATVRRALTNHLSGATPNYRAEMRCLTKQGSWRWIESRGRVVEWTDDGKPWKMSGTRSDITVSAPQTPGLKSAANFGKLAPSQLRWKNGHASTIKLICATRCSGLARRSHHGLLCKSAWPRSLNPVPLATKAAPDQSPCD